MINLLVVGLWLTFLVCVVGFILYKEIHKSKKDLLRVQKAEIASLSITLDEKENSIKGYILDDKRRTDVFLIESLGMFREWFESISKKVRLNQEVLINITEMLVDFSKPTTEEVVEEWVQYFPVNKEYPTVLETWVSSLGTIKNIYTNKTTYSYFSTEYNNHAFDRMQLSLLVAKCFLKPKDENALVMVIDKTKAITIDNILYIDAMESKFLTKTFGISQKSKNCFAAVYRQNNLGYYKTEIEAQKAVHNYRKQWLINNDREEWLDLWKPDFITENN